MSNPHPDRQACYRMFQAAGTPYNVIGHCKAVAAVAYTIGWEINRARRLNTGMGCRVSACGATAGRILDLDLLLSAGLLHDLVRVQADHGRACATLLEGMGLKEEAEIIRDHMYHTSFKDLMILDECELVCLADSLVVESSYVGADARNDYLINKAKQIGFTDHIPNILDKREQVKKCCRQIEDLVGKSIEDMMVDIDYENVEGALAARV